jgi:hypothetical protein
VICGTAGTGVLVVVEWVFDLVTVMKSVIVVSGAGGSVKVMVVNVRVSVEEEDIVAVVATTVLVIFTVVACMVTIPPVMEAIVVVVAGKPRTLNAKALSVHSTTTPAVVFIGIAKQSDPAAHTLMAKLPA